MTAAPCIPRRRVCTRFRPVRETRGISASWTRVEVGPSKVRTSGVVVLYATVALCIAILAGWCGVLARQTVRWENLRSRGLTTTAFVEYSYLEDIGSGNHAHYLSARVLACDCTFNVRVATVDPHPPGSLMPIRYDPRDHSNVVPLVDRTASALGIGIVTFFGVLAAGAALAGSWFRMRHRCKTVVRRYEEKRPVVFDAWKRSFGGNTHYFLVLYAARASERSEPICCVPVLSLSLRRLRDDDVLLLYGHGSQDSVALSREGTVILPCGPAKPGSWEQSLRGEKR
jgi:hypothetical protein